MSRVNEIEEIVKDVDKAIRANFPWDLLNNGYIVSSADNIAQELYYAGYRKASEVAREVIDEIEQNFEIGYGGVLEFRKLLAELKKKYTEGEK